MGIPSNNIWVSSELSDQGKIKHKNKVISRNIRSRKRRAFVELGTVLVCPNLSSIFLSPSNVRSPSGLLQSSMKRSDYGVTYPVQDTEGVVLDLMAAASHFPMLLK